MMPKRILPMGGISNRLRVILSFRALFGEIDILWSRSEGVCRARWEDVFLPLEGVRFIDAGDGPAQDCTAPCDYGPTSSATDLAPVGWTKSYRDLQPAPFILDRVAELKLLIGDPYIAIHARRTDHVEHAARHGHFTTNEELWDWFEQHDRRTPLYVASEDANTLDWFNARIGAGIFCHRRPEHVHGYDVRPGSLADAIVDMWMCLGATDFKGSWFSSFSETIQLLRWRGEPPGGFNVHSHMSSQDESYRVKR